MVLDTEADVGSASAFSYTEVTGGDGGTLRWRDRLTGEQGRIAPRVVVNATGAWVDRVENAIRPAANRRRVQGTKGSHLMIRNPALEKALDGHMVYYEHRDGRICIAFNHAGASMVGSTDIRIDDPGRGGLPGGREALHARRAGRRVPGSGDHRRRDRACLHRGEAAAGERGRGDGTDQPRPFRSMSSRPVRCPFPC